MLRTSPTVFKAQHSQSYLKNPSITTTLLHPHHPQIIIADLEAFWKEMCVGHFFFFYLVPSHLKVLQNYHGHSLAESMYSCFSLLQNVSTDHLKSKRFCFSPHSQKRFGSGATHPVDNFSCVFVASNMYLGNIRWRSGKQMHPATNIYRVVALHHAFF